MNNKRGGKYGIILSLILGLAVVIFFMIFAYQAYWSNGNMDLSICRESVQLRASLPEETILGYNPFQFKKEFPLKCQTIVVDINKNDISNGDYKKIIGDTMAECWSVFGNGDLNAFPSKFYSMASTCVPCARIHLTEDAKNYIEQNKIKIDIRNSLDERMDGRKYSYFTYLNKSGKRFPAFNPASAMSLNPASAMSFNLEGSDFSVGPEGRYVVLTNRLTGLKYKGGSVKNIFSELKMSRVSLPEFFNPQSGDLLVSYGIINHAKMGAIGGYIPYLFYFQTGQKSNPFDVVNNNLFYNNFPQNVKFCGSWEGIPA